MEDNECTCTSCEPEMQCESTCVECDESKTRDNNLYKHALRELKAIGYKADGTDEQPNNWIVNDVLELVRTFAGQGHSGTSAPYVLNIFNKVARFEPVIPLTGEDNEWVEVAEGVFQNNRCCHVFKQAGRFNGQAYDINGKIFVEPDGAAYTNNESFVPITFPYTPKSEFVNVEKNTEE